MTEDGVPSVNPKLDAMCEMLKTIHDLQEKNKQLEAQIEKMKCCENCRYCNEWGEANSNSPNCKKCNWVSNWKLRR